MLEDELREMFGSRVRIPPAAYDPAGAAIRDGKGAMRRRKTVTGFAAAMAFVMLLGAATLLQMLTTPTGAREGTIAFNDLFGQPDSERPVHAGENSASAMKFPVDVFEGTSLWTADGRKLTLTGVQNAMKVVRVPEGWLYSDESHVFLMAGDGSSVQLKENTSTWVVSLDGLRVASVKGGTTLETWRAAGTPIASATIKPGVWPEGFDGESKVILVNSNGGYDHWSGGGGSSYKETWNDNVTAVYGAERAKAVGVVKEKDSACLAELVPTDSGWQPQTVLGCGELPIQAMRAGAIRSPDGKWLAIPTAAGLQLIDLAAAKKKAETPGTPKNEALTAQFSCTAMSNAPAAWIDNESVVTTSTAGGAVACGTDGSRVAVQLPYGASTGWLLVPRFGDIK